MQQRDDFTRRAAEKDAREAQKEAAKNHRLNRTNTAALAQEQLQRTERREGHEAQKQKARSRR